MAVACSIFTLGGWVQLFWTDFDPMFAVILLKVALEWHKFDFWVFQKNNQASECQVNVHAYFFEMPKNKMCAILMLLLMVPLQRLDQKLSKTIEPIHLK